MIDQLRKFCPRVDWRLGEYGTAIGILNTDPHVEIQVSYDCLDDDTSAQLVVGVWNSYTKKHEKTVLLSVKDRGCDGSPLPLEVVRLLWWKMESLNIALGACSPLKDWEPASDPAEWEHLAAWDLG